MKSLRLLFLSIFVLCLLDSSAQVEIIDTLTVEELVNDYLLGEGITATNITFNGLPGDSVFAQVGLFQGSSGVVDFEEGIILATADVVTANDQLNPDAVDISNPLTNDPDLVLVAGETIDDEAIIEFDFIVRADSVKFDYIFASREYPQYTCSDFNDAFGFFISGPGFDDSPFIDNAENIALIPGTDIPVAINTINGGVATGFDPTPELCEAANPNWIEDSQYFVDNENFEEGDFDIPGLTTTFQAEAAVQICEEYHIKLAIGNAFDGALDSYVILKAGSFTALGEISASFNPFFSDSTAVTQEGYDSIAVAGCTNPIIELVKPECACFDNIEYSFSDQGDAVIGEDFATVGQFPPPTFEEQGSDVIYVEIETLDETETDTLNIVLVIDFLTCEGIEGQTVIEIPIAPAPEIELTTEDITLICPTDSVLIQVTADNGLLPYVYDWEDIGEPGEFTDFGQFIETDIPGEDEGFVRQYIVRVRDKCDFKESTDTLLLTNNIPLPLQSSINPFADPVCPNEPVDLTVVASNGVPPYGYIWSDSRNSDINNGQASTTADDINPAVIAFTDTLDVQAIVIDDCGTTDTARVRINYPEYDSLSVSFTPLFDNCPETAVQLESIVEGGAGDFTYTWSIDGESTFTDGFGPSTANTFIDAGSGFNTFSLAVQDQCNRAGHDMFLRTDEDGMPIFSGFDDHEQTIPYIKLDPLPNIITPNGDGLNEVFVVPGINAFENASVLIYDRWGKLIYENSSYDAGVPGEATVSQGFSADGFSDGTYLYIINIDSGECVTQGNLEVVGGNE